MVLTSEKARRLIFTLTLVSFFLGLILGYNKISIFPEEESGGRELINKNNIYYILYHNLWKLIKNSYTLHIHLEIPQLGYPPISTTPNRYIPQIVRPSIVHTLGLKLKQFYQSDPITMFHMSI